MHGNVWEWCLDRQGSYPGAVSDPKGAASGPNRIMRGGSFDFSASYARSAFREYDGPSNRSNDFGFRLARTLP